MYNPETKLWEGYIYIIKNDCNNFVYIGQTKRTIKRRWQGHLDDSRGKTDKTLFHRAMKTIGVGHFYPEEIVRISKRSSTELSKELNRQERYYIRFYNSKFPNGYNVSSGGTGFNNEFKPCVLFDLDGNLLQRFRNLEEASLITGVNKTSVSNNCRGKIYRTKLGVFRYAEDPFDKYPLHGSKDICGPKDVCLYDLSGNLVKVFGSIKTASEYLGVSYGALLYKYKHNYIIKSQYILIDKEKPFDLNHINLEKHKRPVVEINNHGQIVNTFDGVIDACDKTGISLTRMYLCCSGEISETHNRRFILLNKYLLDKVPV